MGKYPYFSLINYIIFVLPLLKRDLFLVNFLFVSQENDFFYVYNCKNTLPTLNNTICFIQ